MALNSILSSALTALQTNTAALRVVSNNIANMNTPGYARRVVDEQPLVLGGQLAGVDISDVQRVVDSFYTQESLSANASSSQYSTQSSIYDQLNSILGQPGDGTALTTKLDNIFSALGNAELTPTASASQQGVLSSLQDLASSISSMSSAISSLQSQADQQVVSSIGSVNGLIKQVYTLNSQIQTAMAQGTDDSGLLDQRDQAIQNLSQYMDVRTVDAGNGQLKVMTGDGVNLVSDTYAQLSYAGGSSNGSYGSIGIQNINPSTGAAIGSLQALDPHLAGGSLKGLTGMRDGALADLQNELGAFAQNTANAFNAVSNASAAFPPPTALSGRDTGLLASDGLNFSGKTTLAVADANGNLVSRVDVDFDAGTLSVNGGASVSIGNTIGSFASALNTALGSNGSASFADGSLDISASGGNGLVVQDDTTDPSNRGGVGFSQFFGLNDLFTSAAPTLTATGLSSADDGGFAAGSSMSFVLKDASGNVAKQASVTLSAGMSIGDIVNALNTSFGGAATFALGSDGGLTMTPAPSYAGYSLNVTGDSTQRGGTGLSFTALFGLGSQAAAAQAQGFSVDPAIAANPATLPLAQASLDTTTAAGDNIVGSADNRGLLALQALETASQSFGAAGGLPAQSSTLNQFANGFYQDVATRSTTASTNATTQSDRLSEAQSRQSSVSGVNLDEELSNMMTYQQAYSAGARVLQVVQQLYDTLLQIPTQ